MAVTNISLSATRDIYVTTAQVLVMAVVVCGNQRVIVDDGLVQVLRTLYVVLSGLNNQYTKGEELLMVS